MKIAIITDAVWPWSIGGSEIRNYEIAKRLVVSGHEVHIYGAKLWPEKEKIKKIDGVIIHGISEMRKLYDHSGKRKKIDSLKLGIKMFFVLMRADFDIADVAAFSFFNCFSAWAVCLIRRRKLVLTWHQYFGKYLIDAYGKNVGSKIILLEKLTTRLTKNNIAVSENVKQKLVLAGVKQEDIAVLPNGVDLDAINKATPIEEKSDLIFVGRLQYQKNVTFILDVTAELKKKFRDIKVTIIGDGPDKATLVEKSEALGITNNINFVGGIKNRDLVYKYLKSSKIFVLPSLLEGFPLTAIEANASGLPVVVSRTKNNDISEYIKEGVNGFNRDLTSEEFVNIIVTLLKEKTLLKEMILKSQNQARSLNWKDITKRQEKYYFEILQN